jgi:hypothetical protein
MRKKSSIGGRRDFRVENNVGSACFVTLRLILKKVIAVLDLY